MSTSPNNDEGTQEDPETTDLNSGRSPEETQAVAKVDVPRIVATIESEMTWLEKRLTRTGITTWASLVATAGIAWLILGIVEQHLAVIAGLDLLSILVAFSIFCDGIYGGYRAFSTNKAGLQSGGGFGLRLTSVELRISTHQMLLLAVRGFALLVGCYTLLHSYLGWLVWPPVLLYGIIVVFLPLSLLFRNVRAHIPRVANRKWHEILASIGVAGMIIAAGAIAITGLIEAGVLIAMYQWKIAVLCVGLCYGLLFLVSPKHEFVALESLRTIRRALGFGQISPEEAIAQTQVIIVGYRASRILATEMVSLAAGVHRFRNGLFKILVSLRSFDAASKQAADDVSIVTFASLEDSFCRLMQRYDEIEEEWEDIEQSAENFENRLSKWEHASSGEEDFTAFRRAIDTITGRARDQLDEFRMWIIARHRRMADFVRRAEAIGLRVEGSTHSALRVEMREPSPRAVAIMAARFRKSPNPRREPDKPLEQSIPGIDMAERSAPASRTEPKENTAHRTPLNTNEKPQ